MSTRINIARDFSDAPGPRYREQGASSGEALREDVLKPAIEVAIRRNERLVVELDGTQYGYPICFLEEAFGGLVRTMGHETAKRIRFEGDRETRQTIQEVMGDAFADHLPRETTSELPPTTEPAAHRFTTAIGHAIRDRMHRLAISTSEVASRSGLTGAKVERCNAGDDTMQVKDIATVAEALGMGPDDFSGTTRAATQPPPAPKKTAHRTMVANDVNIAPGETTRETVERELTRVLKKRRLNGPGTTVAVIDNPGANPATGTWAVTNPEERTRVSGTWTLRRHHLLARPNLQIQIETPEEER